MGKTLDLNNKNVQLIIGAMANLVDEGMTPHQVFDTLEQIKRETFHALAEIHRTIYGECRQTPTGIFNSQNSNTKAN